jgi:hypothetical protein
VKDLHESVNMSLMRYKGGTATYLSFWIVSGPRSQPNSPRRRQATTNTKA